jgi:hypothetical protein
MAPRSTPEPEEGAHVVQPPGPSGYSEPRGREEDGHRDAGQEHVDRQAEDDDEPEAPPAPETRSPKSS